MSPWTFQVNDPTLIAWVCVLAYVFAAICGYIRALHSSSRERSFWLGIALWCGLLAANKQLDVHSALLVIVRQPATGNFVMWMAVGIFLALGGVAVFLILPALRRSSTSMLGAISSLCGLAVILVGRNTIPALSGVLGFHLTSETETLLHLHVSELFELLLAGVIVLTARRPRGPSISGPQLSHP